MKKLFPVALVVGGLALGLNCSAPKPQPVRVTRATRGDLVARYVSSGHVTSKIINVSSQEGGILSTVVVQENQNVRKGQVVASLDNSEQRAKVDSLRAQLQATRGRYLEATHTIPWKRNLVASSVAQARAARQTAFWKYQAVMRGFRPEEIERAQATLREAEARLHRGILERQRTEKLFGQDIASQAELEKAVAEEREARAQKDQAAADVARLTRGNRPEDVAAARAEVDKAQAELQHAATGEQELPLLQDREQTAAEEVKQLNAQLQVSQAVLDRTILKSPVDGVVSQILLQPGEVARAGTPVLSLVADKGLWVEADVNEQDAGFVTLNQEVKLRLSSQPGKEFKGKVVRLPPSLESIPGRPGDAKVLHIRVEFDDKVEALRPGLEADVEGTRVLAKQCLILPRAAVLRFGNQDYVMTVEAGKSRKTPIKLGEVTTDQVQVTQGVDENTQVVIDHPESLLENTSVSPQQ